MIIEAARRVTHSFTQTINGIKASGIRVPSRRPVPARTAIMPRYIGLRVYLNKPCVTMRVDVSNGRTGVPALAKAREPHAAIPIPTAINNAPA